MDLDKGLIESGKRKQPRSWGGVTGSLLLHGAMFGTIAALSMNAKETVHAEEKATPVYMQHAAAPPPPPPPPPPAASASAPQRPTPKIQQPKPVEVPKFVAPTEVPKTVPVVEQTTDAGTDDDYPSEPLPPSAPIGGVPGGVEGGTVGGQIGGQLGGVIGGVSGGVVGGTPGGVLGGTPGGTGTAPAPAVAAPPPPPPPPAPPAGPVRVGGSVSAPSVVSRFEPRYPEPARRARVSGVVIVEAIIDKNGNVDNVRVVKGLPMGLSEAAADAVRRWKFRPGMQHGRPVDVIFNLTVVFTLGNDAPKVGAVSKPQPKPQPQRAPDPPKREDPPVAAEEPPAAPSEPTAEPTSAPQEGTQP